MTVQHMIVRVPGWVTAVSLCCFCNVALIFATMKTFILQQVKCCHLSPFLFKLIYSLDPFHWFTFLFSRREVSSASFITCFSFRRSPHLSRGLSFSDSLYFSEWRSLVGLLFFGGVDLRGLTVHICPYLLIFAMVSVTNEKSICPADSDMVLGQRILASCSCFSVTSSNFQFTGIEGVGRGGCPLFFFLGFLVFQIWKCMTFAVTCYKTFVFICPFCGPWMSHQQFRFNTFPYVNSSMITLVELCRNLK